ncbi:MAG: transporter, YjgP/YjgQ family, partial [Acidobacteriaceae bacterium]|nr:transporter, YjgP/YjgQ family [Acidobacteriaceae bacterium]
MRILTRYILREVTSHALIGAGIFTFVLFTKELGQILELVVRNSAPLPSVAEVFFLTLPSALTYTIPMGVLVGILIGLSRLAADSEITAMRASGIGVWTFLRIISIFVFVGWMLALINGTYLAPLSQAALSRLQDRLKGSQVSFEVQPRVFYEGFPKLVLYVQDVKSAKGGALWKGVFIADISTPSSPKITLAQQGILVSESPETLHLHLVNGSTHETDPTAPDHYQISTFEQTDMPIDLPQADTSKEQEPVPVTELSTRNLILQRPVNKKMVARWYDIEFHRRLALPTACVVLALVGIPLGLSSKKGGKSTGFVLTIILVFAYYFVSLLGVSLARQGRVPPGVGVWLADMFFFLGGAFLLWRAERRPFDLSWLRIKNPLPRSFKERRKVPRVGHSEAYERASTRVRVFRARFPMILDDYVLRDFALNLAMVLSTFLMLLLVFTLFELLGDILRNQISPVVVGEYLLNVIPYFIYSVMPFTILLAVLITLGLMHRSNEIVAIKATGISIYRVIVPVLIAAIVLATGLFFFDQFYLPHANKRQDALRNIIKGKPAQTYLNPERKWIFGQNSTIFYYQLFDSDRNQFGNLSVFQFNPANFELTHRIYADRAHWDEQLKKWVCTQGWQRVFRGPAIEDYRT